MSKVEDFWLWAERELMRQGLTWYSLEKEAGLGNAAISRRARERITPTFGNCIAIADAFNLPQCVVLRRAGLVDPEPNADPLLEEALYYLDQLTDEQREFVMTELRALALQRLKEMRIDVPLEVHTHRDTDRD